MVARSSSREVPRLERAQHAAVVRVVARADDAAAPGAVDRDAHGLALEELRRLAELAHEDEGPGALEELLRGVGELEEEARPRRAPSR